MDDNKSTALPAADGAKIAVLIVDDSAVIRGLIRRMVEAESDMIVQDSSANGQMAVKAVQKGGIDVVVLDIDMPVMDGLTALPQIIAASPGIQVIMASTLTTRNAETSIKAMDLGAADYIPKPTSNREISGSGDTGDEFHHELIQKIRALGERTQKSGRVKTPQKFGDAKPQQKPAAAKVSTTGNALPKHPRILAVGSSTGGPQALFRFMEDLGKDFPVPIVITQHMPATFTTILAKNITERTNIPCKEGEDGDPLLPNQALLAPGDHHMVVEGTGAFKTIRLNQDPKVNFCRPAVDPMFLSVTQRYGPDVIGVILTGMGHDGLTGGQAIVNAGGGIVAQDEATSVVWGMPGAVAEAGICNAVLPLDKIGAYVRDHIDRTRK